MADREIFELHIEKVVPKGFGLGFHEGMAVFVPFTAPGDRIRVRVTKKRHTHLFAHGLEVLARSPERRDPDCDLFTQCGGCQLRHLKSDIGNFTLPLTQHFEHVLGVENHAPTLQRASTNAGAFLPERIRFKCLDLFREEEIKQLKTEQSADLVLLDPPREGARHLVTWLTTCLPERLVYISCNPATFARDAAILVDGGLQLKKVQPMDLFPQTFHVELVALFVRSQV